MRRISSPGPFSPKFPKTTEISCVSLERNKRTGRNKKKIGKQEGMVSDAQNSDTLIQKCAELTVCFSNLEDLMDTINTTSDEISAAIGRLEDYTVDERVIDVLDYTMNESEYYEKLDEFKEVVEKCLPSFFTFLGTVEEKTLRLKEQKKEVNESISQTRYREHHSLIRKANRMTRQGHTEPDVADRVPDFSKTDISHPAMSITNETRLRHHVQALMSKLKNNAMSDKVRKRKNDELIALQGLVRARKRDYHSRRLQQG
jgi:hypothetical protein